jgi:hypothetical protein
MLNVYCVARLIYLYRIRENSQLRSRDGHLIIQLYSIQEPLYHTLFRNKVKKSTLNQGNRSINKRIGVVHIQLKDALNSNYHLMSSGNMQSLWGCAYEMRSLGDVNYKITATCCVQRFLVMTSNIRHY